MRENGIRARHKRCYKVTTDTKHNLPIAPNLLDRNFNPAAPNQVWTSDTPTSRQMRAGYIWLSCLICLIVKWFGWSLKPRMTADIVTDALTMAWFRKKTAPGLMHHLDRGSQYASKEFQRELKKYSMICSMSRKGNCWDNVPTESWSNSFKNERVHGLRYETHAEMTAMSFEYIEVLYNRKRQHSTLGYKSPMQFLNNWLITQQKEKLIA